MSADTRAELGDAWAAAEAALPEGWHLYGVTTSLGLFMAMAMGPYGEAKRCDQGSQHHGKTDTAHAQGDTPAAALRALAVALAEPPR